jgi:hypothetical protein
VSCKVKKRRLQQKNIIYTNIVKTILCALIYKIGGELKMKELLMNEAGRTFTENGAVTNATTGNDVLNLFALGGAVRNRDVRDVVNLIDAAWKENQDLTLKVIFYLGDVRGGQGERRFFNTALKYLANKAQSVARNIMELVPEYSRWDMLFAFMDTPLQSYAFDIMHRQFNIDLVSVKPSLLAKWLPSPGTKSQKNLAVKVARAFGLELGQYRKLRARLNRQINTVEVKMSAREWDSIDYETVPGKAFMIYQRAFERHGYEKMQKFVQKIQSGEAKVKSDVLYPHEIMSKAIRARYGSTEEATLENAWKNLPNYIGDDRQGIAVIDTSYSMETRIGNGNISCMDVAKSMGLYLSERLSGPYKDHYITFSEKPIMAKFHGSTLADKYRNMRDIVASTDIEAVYNLILDIAVKHNVSQDELPTHLYIFSDMEFNHATLLSGMYFDENPVNKTLFETIETRYNAHGFRMPVTIFWNLDARHNQHPVSQHSSGAVLVSGFSPATFKYITTGVTVTPYEIMLNVLESPRYATLSKAFE